MRGSVKRRLTSVVLAASAFGMVGLAGIGCDKLGGGTQVQADARVAEVIQTMDAARTQPSPDAVRQGLEKAAGVSDASAPTRAHAKTLLAQSELDVANALVDEIDRKEIQIAGLVWDIGALADRIDAATRMAAGYAKLDPAPLRDGVAKRIADAQGGTPQRTRWIGPEDQPGIPNLSTLKQTISRLEGEITTQEGRIAALTEERTKLLEEAEKAQQQSLALSGRQSVEEYNRGSDLRRKAAGITMDIDRCQAALLPLRQDLAVAQGQLQIVEAVIAQFQNRGQTIDEAWTQIQQQIDAQTAFANRVTGDEAAAGEESITAKVRQMAALVEEVRKLREEATRHLTNAASHFQQANSAAAEAMRSLAGMKDPAFKDAPQLEAWKRLSDMWNPLNWTLQQAVAQRALAGLKASDAESLTNRLRLSRMLARIYGEAKLQLPKELPAEADLAKQVATARQETDSAYDDADKLLKTAIEAPSAGPERVLAARVSRMFALYGWSQALRAAGNAAGAKEKLEMAANERDSALERGATLPVLPAALVPPPRAAAAKPAAAPAARPGTPAGARPPAGRVQPERAPAAPARK